MAAPGWGGHIFLAEKGRPSRFARLDRVPADGPSLGPGRHPAQLQGHGRNRLSRAPLSYSLAVRVGIRTAENTDQAAGLSEDNLGPERF